MHVKIRPGQLKAALLVGIALATAAGVVACGSGSGAKTAVSSAAATSAAASASSSDSRAARANPFDDPTVAACLKAAGITVPTFAAPTGSFTRGTGARPSGSFTRPTGARPSGSFTRPSGADGGFGGGAFGTDSTEIQAALKACGITLPTGGAGFGGRGGSGAPNPSATPSS
jgi:hypothetical protein